MNTQTVEWRNQKMLNRPMNTGFSRLLMTGRCQSQYRFGQRGTC